jgi:Tol biopolymer transport system component
MTVPGNGVTDLYFGISKLSPDQQKVAAESYYYDSSVDGFYVYNIIVFDLAGNTLALFEGASGPEWLPDGRLLLVGDGLYITDAALTNPTRIDGGQLNSPVGNPDVDPSGEFVAFEYNQQIWGMNLDGSGLRELISGPKYFKFPTWSPDGSTLAYLATEQHDYYDKAVYFTDVSSEQDYVLDLASILDSSVSNVPNGPLSWTE